MALDLCPNIICNKPIDSDDKYCGYCDCRVKPILCEACGAPKKNRGHLYCTKCGKGYTLAAEIVRSLTIIKKFSDNYSYSYSYLGKDKERWRR